MVDIATVVFGIAIASLPSGWLIIKSIIAILNYQTKRDADKIGKALSTSTLSAQYTKDDIADAVRGYIEPECSSTDPANSAEIAAYSDVRQNIFDVIDNSITFAKSKQFQLLLADSGMGKTSFCLNYLRHFRKVTKSDDIALVSLATGDADTRIKIIPHHSSKIIILDALDEDRKAILNGKDRLYEILELCRDFKAVIVTCRSQFFANDLAIPQETGVSMLVPRKAGQNSTYHLTRLYLTPFNRNQVRRYINKHFPRWYIYNFLQRRRAIKLVASVEELTARPMLLELLPDLIKSNTDAKELYDLYSFMVDSWLQRESNWIDQKRLLSVSKKLAVYIHNRHAGGGGDRVTVMELNSVARQVSDNESDWDHLTTRSLLNRDSKGLFKFAHRSIMEYLFVASAIDGDADTKLCRWTDFMKELFISWGYTEDGAANLPAAERLITSDLATTGLFPLSEPPTGPTNAPDFEIAANRRGQSRNLKRQATPLWRLNSVTITQSGYSVELIDLEFYKRWLLTDPIKLAQQGLSSTYSSTIANVQRSLLQDADYRAPSYAEFITLVEAVYASGREDLLPEGHLFYLGDKLGDRRHLVVSISQSPRFREQDGLVSRDKARLIDLSGRYLLVSEVGMYAAVNSLANVRAVPIRIANVFD